MLAQKNIFHFSTMILTRGGTLRWMMAAHLEHDKNRSDQFLICWPHSPGLHSAPTPSPSTTRLKPLARLEITLEMMKAPVAAGARPRLSQQRQKSFRPIFDMLAPQPRASQLARLEITLELLKAPVAVGARPASTSQRQKMDRPIFDMLPPQPHPTPSLNLGA